MGTADPREPPLDRLDNAEAVVRSVREAVGNKADILIGTHGQSTTSGTIRFARRIEQFDPLWFEEPVPPENRDEMARVARATTIPVASGERLATKFEFRELLEKQAAAILQMALGRVGGILEARKIAGMAEAYYAQIAATPLLRADRGGGQHPGRHLQPELPHPGEHRAVRWVPRRDPEGAYRVARRLHHPADQAGARRGVERGGGGEAPVPGTGAKIVSEQLSESAGSA